MSTVVLLSAAAVIQILALFDDQIIDEQKIQWDGNTISLTLVILAEIEVGNEEYLDFHRIMLRAGTVPPQPKCNDMTRNDGTGQHSYVQDLKFLNLMKIAPYYSSWLDRQQVGKDYVTIPAARRGRIYTYEKGYGTHFDSSNASIFL